MNIEHYTKFLNLQEKGLKKLATKELRAFIDSFSDQDEKSEWVWSWLPKLKKNRHSRIRHELFSELIFPVLKNGYFENDFRSTLWLVKLNQNISQNHKADEELGWITNLDLLSKCHQLDPANDEARVLYIEAIVSQLAYYIHEWPSAVLYGNDGANLEQCEVLRADISLLSSLDQEKVCQNFINDFLEKLSEYEARIRNGNSLDVNR